MSAVQIVLCSVVLLGLLNVVPEALAATANAWRTRTIYQVLTDRFNNPNGGSCSNLGNYCGGTFKGLVSRLDYIKDLGFDAIWISPVIENTDGGYHGYWAKNLYNVNSHFGTAEDLRNLVAECHKRDIWVMLDVVMNHMGSCSSRNDFSCLYPFNSADHYHSDNCDINNWQNQHEVENCRLSGLPDLRQENTWVEDTLINWTKDMINQYDFDGLRLDTILEVPTWFWDDFSEKVGIFCIGEGFNGDIAYLGPYQDHVDSVFNYPLYYKLRDSYGRGKSMWDVSNMLKSMPNYYYDPSLVATFIENHDNPRWMSELGQNYGRFRNALTFALVYEGIPVIYYGAEQGFHGGADPNCRETLWTTGFPESGVLWDTIQTLAQMRHKNYNDWVSSDAQERYVLDDLYVWSRGSVLATTTNIGSGKNGHWTISNTPFSNGERVCNVFYPSDCLNIGSDGSFDLYLNDGEPKVWVRASDINNYLA